MAFLLLVFLAAFSLEGIGTLISILGITKFWGFDWIVIALAAILDLGKIVTVSFLYKEWKDMPKLLRFYSTIASIVLVLITSTGAAAFLSAKFQQSMLPTEAINIQIKSLEEEKQKLELRKVQIDDQIAHLPPEQVKGRTKLIANFRTETDHLNERLVKIDEELPKIKMDAVDKKTHSGPIISIAASLNTSVEKVQAFIIGLIIFVFDPLAISLILSGNYLIDKRSKKQKNIETKIENIPLIKEPEVIEPEIIQEVIPEIKEIDQTHRSFKNFAKWKRNYKPSEEIYDITSLPEEEIEQTVLEIPEEEYEDDRVFRSILNEVETLPDVEFNTVLKHKSEMRSQYEQI